MIKHASSHGLSIFVCTIISALIIDVFRPLLPELYKKFEMFSQNILNYIPLPISPDTFNIIIIAMLLGVLWGIIFKLRFAKN